MLFTVMAGLVPDIHDFTCCTKVVDDRDEPGHDDVQSPLFTQQKNEQVFDRTAVDRVRP
jgi:hypothetical protein